MILNSTKFGGNRTKDVEVGPDRRTDRQTGRFLYTPQTMFAGDIKSHWQDFLVCFAANANKFYIYRQCTYIVFIMQCQKVQNRYHIVPDS